MGSNERDQATQHHHPPHISSVVVRPSGSNDGEDGLNATAGGFESREVSRDRPSFGRSDRHKDDNGPRTRARSTSPARRVYEDHRHNSDFNHPPRGRDFSSRREAPERHRDYSPPYTRGGDRPHLRGFDGPPELPRGPFKTEGMMGRAKITPRDGDWYCLVLSCRNLNFARREFCNKCKRHRYTPAPNSPPRRLPPPTMNHFNGHRSPTRDWVRDYAQPTWRDRDNRVRDRPRYSELDYPPKRRIASDWVQTEPLPKPHYERRQPPPPLSPRGGRYGRVSRERSRSPLRLRDGHPPPPMRGGPPPPHRDYRGDGYIERGGRDDRRDGGRDRMGNFH